MPIGHSDMSAKPAALARWSMFHSIVASAAALAALAATLTGASLSSAWQVPLLAAATAVVGMPHGGLDHHFGRAVCRPLAGAWWPLPFAAFYLGAAALVLAGWAAAPLPTIAFFFILSAFHFGEGGPLPSSAVEGGMVIWAPFLARPEEASKLLAWVAPGQSAGSILALAVEARPLLWALAAATAVRAAGLAWSAARDRRAAPALEALRLSAFGGLLAAAPVLLGFVVFFCGWHSTRELIDLAAKADPERPSRGLVRVIRAAAPLSVLVVAAAAACAWGRIAAGAEADEAVVQAVFLGLSAVAVPHIFLHAIADGLGVGAAALRAQS